MGFCSFRLDSPLQQSFVIQRLDSLDHAEFGMFVSETTLEIYIVWLANRRICGKIKGSLALNLFMAISGAVLEFSLVFFAHLGVFGAALGYCLALGLSAAIGMIPFVLGRNKLRFVRPRLSAELVHEITAAGMPAFLNNVAGRVTSVLLNAALLAQGGEDAVAVYGVLMYASGVVFPLLYGT